MKYYSEEEYYEDQIRQKDETIVDYEFGCGFCWDKKRQKSKELFFLDAANNMRPCIYCPHCGREYE